MTNDLIYFGGVEVINTERLAAYVASGIVPPTAQVTVDVCDGLAEAAVGPSWAPYTTPLQDEPPWFDASDPDTADFAGVLPLDVTGLDATTRTVEVFTTVRGTGIAGRPTRGPQTVGATAVLIGRTTEGVKAGLAWLRRVLHGACDADEQPCAYAATLETYTACPGPITATANPDAPATLTEPQPYAVGGDPEAWLVIGGDLSDNGDGALITPYDADVLVIEGGGAPEVPDVIESDADTEDPIYFGGDASPIGSATVGSLRQDACGLLGPFTITWTLRGVVDGVTARLVILGTANTVIAEGPTVTLTDTAADYTWNLPDIDGDDDFWTPAIIVEEPVVVTDVSVSGFLPTTAEECIAPYRRLLPVTTVTSGPTPVELIDADCAVLMVVEWIWVSTSPWRYGTTVPVLLGLGWGDVPTLTAPGVTYEEGGVTLVDATPWNCTPPVDVTSCAIDPALPTLGAPPAYPEVVDTNRARITTEDVRDVWALIGPEQIPADQGVLTIELTAGADPVVGIRVRVWGDAAIDGSVPDLCDFAYEFLIDYVPANGVLTIDGTSGRVTTVCGGTSHDSTQGVRGAYGGPIEDPVVRCDRRYLVRVQWLDTYPRTATGVYTLGDPNGDLTVNLHVTPREG